MLIGQMHYTLEMTDWQVLAMNESCKILNKKTQQCFCARSPTYTQRGVFFLIMKDIMLDTDRGTLCSNHTSVVQSPSLTLTHLMSQDTQNFLEKR